MANPLSNLPTGSRAEKRRDEGSIEAEKVGWKNDPTSFADDLDLIFQTLIPFASLLVGAALAFVAATNHNLPERAQDFLSGTSQAIVAGSLGAMGTSRRR